MNRVPFMSYDFFGYLASGLLFMAGMQQVLGFPQVTGRNLTVTEGALLILTVYVAGQILASPSKGLFDDLFVGRLLGRPHTTLLRNRPTALKYFFPGYYTPLPATTRGRVIERAKSEGVDATGEALFLHIRFHETTRQDEQLIGRLDSFLNQYGFARNLAFTCLIIGVPMLIKGRNSSDPTALRYGGAALVASIFLVYRYLKFFRQYTYELFNSYAGGKK